MLNKRRNILDVIRCDESEYLIWKWHPSNISVNSKNRENAIRYGSSLRVKQGEVAVFIYNHNGEMITEYIGGPTDRILETDNLPVISDLFEKMFGKGTPFQAEVYFINLSKSIQLKFGVPFFKVCDYRTSAAPVPIAVRGTITFKIADCKEFVNINGLAGFNADDLYNRIRGKISLSVKERVPIFLSTNEVTVSSIENHLTKFSQEISSSLCEKFRTEYAIDVSEISVDSIEIDTFSEEYHKGIKNE